MKDLELITFKEQQMTGEILEVPDVVEDDDWACSVGCCCNCTCACSCSQCGGSC